MEPAEHFKRLERVYASAPIVRMYNTSYITISENRAEISLQCERKFFHSAGAMHGSVYFRMLDDAAYFAASSAERKHFLVTKSFSIQFLRPVSEGKIKAVGSVDESGKSGYKASAVLYDENEKVLAKGSGEFAFSKLPMADALGYSS